MNVPLARVARLLFAIVPPLVLVAMPDRSCAQQSRLIQAIGTAPQETRAAEPPSPADIQAAIDRGIEFLVRDQNADGSWGSATRTKGLNIYAPVPGAHHAFRTATTSLCIAALIEADAPTEAAQQSLRRGEDWLMEQLPRLRRATPDALYNVWGHAYSIQALVRMLGRQPDDPARRERLLELIEEQVDLLVRYESIDGGWGYYDFGAQTQRPNSLSTSFTSATTLIALYEAQQAGVAPPERIVERAVASINRQQKPDYSYLYGEYLRFSPMMPINRPGGSLGRSQACNVALRLWDADAIGDEVIRQWLRRLFDRNLWLDIGRKRPVPHEAWFQIAGYFYYYGHYYAALAIEQLPAGERAEFQSHLAATLVPLQERDGSWWDYPLYDYHQPYGTSFAVMSLVCCLPHQDTAAAPSHER